MEIMGFFAFSNTEYGKNGIQFLPAPKLQTWIPFGLYFLISHVKYVQLASACMQVIEMTMHSNDMWKKEWTTTKKQSSFHFRFQTQKIKKTWTIQNAYVKKEWIKKNNNNTRNENPESLDKQWNDKHTKRTQEWKQKREIKIQNQKVIGCIDSWK